MRYLILVISIIMIFLMTCIGGAQIAFKWGQDHRNPALIKLAQRINPFESDYYYEEYQLTHDITPLLTAMLLEPTKPAYHMYYGLALLNAKWRTRANDEEGIREICKASTLKPYSSLFREACDKARTVIPLERQSR